MNHGNCSHFNWQGKLRSVAVKKSLMRTKHKSRANTGSGGKDSDCLQSAETILYGEVAK